MDAFEIRNAIPLDAEAAAGYHARCFASVFAAQLRAGELRAPDRDGTRQQLVAWFGPESGFETRVAIIDHSPVAHVTVRDHQLVHLFVAPEHQSVGLGRHLLRLGETMIEANGHTHLELHARIENTAAIAFYEHAGWTVTDRLIHTVEHGISYDERVLVKQL